MSSDDEVRRKLAHVLRQCALAPLLASTVAESGMVLAGHEISVVVCNDRMDNGKYEDIVKLVVRYETKVPVIVVSRTGDWPEYLTAKCGGAFDYLVYPPIPGDLQETIRNALLGQSTEKGHGHQTRNSSSRWGRCEKLSATAATVEPAGCRCQVAESCRDACNRVSRAQFYRSTSCLASTNCRTEQRFRCWTGL